MFRRKTRCLSWILVFLDLWRCARADLYTALASLEPLQESHWRVINSVNYYLYKEELRINVLKRYLTHYEQEQETMAIKEFSLNPVNSYKLIKRLTIDLSFIEEQINKQTAYHVPKNTIYPTVKDLEGAAQAVGRVYNAYDLNSTQLAQGLLSGYSSRESASYTETFTPFTMSDCYELSRKLYSYGDYKGGVQWMKTAFQLFNPEERFLNRISKKRIMKFIVYGYHQMGDAENIIEWFNMISDIEENRERSVHYAIMGHRYENALAKKNADMEKRPAKKPDKLEKLKRVTEREFEDYRSLCRGQSSVPAEVGKRLKCWYLTATHPFLRLAPIKLEQLYENPHLVLLHDMMTDNEIEELKRVAKPNLLHEKRNMADIAEIQIPITKKAFIPYKSTVIRTVTQRIADVTMLNMDSSEDLMVANYGIGGHYGPHYDFVQSSPDKKSKGSKQGDRLASFLFYMSDVAQGGATVFLHLGVTVFPVKGAALMWRNLLPSGEVDHATRHAACPVLRGNKWVAMKWIHGVGQELLAPCSLEYQNSTNPTRKLSSRIPKKIFSFIIKKVVRK